MKIAVAVVDHGRVTATATANQSAVRSQLARLKPGKIARAPMRGPSLVKTLPV
jgi:hypothetical protein